MEYKEICLYLMIIIVGIFIAQNLNVVVSESMEPIMYRGDIIITDHNVKNIDVGDIIIYNGTWLNPPVNVVHRIIKKEEINGTLIYTTKGDNNPIEDPDPVYPNQLIAKVISINQKPIVIPKIGYITLIIRGL